MPTQPSFEDSLTKLEAIVEKMESGDLKLEDSLKLFEEGMKLTKECNQRLNEIEKIFTVLERLGISREAVVIPLRPAVPGRVRTLPNGKYEIVVDAQVPIDDWLPVLEQQLRSAMRQ